MVKYSSKFENEWNDQLNKQIMRVMGRVDRVYAQAAKSMAGYFNQIQPTEDLQRVWTKNKGIEKKIDNILDQFNNSLRQEFDRSFKDGWFLADEKHDQMAAEYLKGIAIGSELKKGMFDRNMKAMDNFLKSGYYGDMVSDRVWSITKQTKEQLKFFAAAGIGTGRDSRRIAADLKKYLKDPDKRFRRVRDKKGKLKPSAPASKYHPGRGVYRSSYKNSWRYIATQTNQAYRTEDFNRFQKEPWVVGIKINLSGAHPRYDICDDLVGQYPPDYKFTGFHPWCICYVTTITLTPKEFANYMKTGKVPPNKYVTQPPTRAISYLNDHLEQFKGWKNPPQFLRENYSYSGNKVGFSSNFEAGNKNLDKTLNDIQKPEIRDLTDEEINACSDYSRIAAFELNEAIREGWVKEDFKLNNMKSSIESAIRHTKKFKGNVYRGISFHHDYEMNVVRPRLIEEARKGYITDKAFLSTSKDIDIAEGYAPPGKGSILIKIKAKGKNGVDFENIIMETEGQVVFQTETTFKVKYMNIKDKDSISEIHLEEL